MFQKILIPLDLTEKHQAALHLGAELAAQYKGEIILFHVIEPLHGAPDKEVHDFYSRLEQTARDHLEAQGKFLTLKRIPWKPHVAIGPRVKEIVSYSHQEKTDLILVTAPHFDPEAPTTGWGSMSWKIGILAPCPVLLAK